MRRRWITIVFGAAALVSCRPDGAPSADAGVTSATPAPTSASATAAGSAGPSAVAPDAGTGTLELLKMTLTSGIKNKEPTDVLESARPGQRVWAHLSMRNRTGRPQEIEV